MQPFGVLFDLDGVLIDTEGLYTDFWASVGRKFNCPSPTFALDIKGTTLTDILNTHFAPQQHDAVKRMIHEFEDTMIYRLFDGVEPFLADLRSLGAKIAIVTSSDDVKMGYLFSQLPTFAEKFDVVVNGSMVKHSKPDPEGYIAAATALGIVPERCIVFEDSLQGLEAGHRSGAHVVALATTNPRARVEPLADITLDSFNDLSASDLVSRFF